MGLKMSGSKLDDFAAYSLTLDEGVNRGLREAASRTDAVTWPDRRYYQDPRLFFLEILALRPWAKQIEIAEAVRDNERVTVATCHKIGKSLTEACLAFWWWASLPDSRVVMTATTAYQIKNIVWREIHARGRWAKQGVCYHCRKLEEERQARRGFSGESEIVCPHGTPITNEIHLDPAHGILAEDLRQIVGFTGRDAEAVAGVSSPNLLYLLDEASGIPNEIYAAIEGNRAGGAKLCLMGNPTQNEGEFFESHHTKDYCRIQVSALEVPNVIEGWRVIPGLATRSWVEQKKIDWGEDSPDYLIRVLGKFAVGDQGKTISLAMVSAAVDRWYDTPFEGRLFIGLDVAGAGMQGDETVFAFRRGLKILEFRAHRGLNEEGILVNLLGYLQEFKVKGDDVPVVVLDAEGDVGNAVNGELRRYSEEHPGEFELVSLKVSQKAVKMPLVYDTIRDDSWANFVRWIRKGGSFPDNDKLRREVQCPAWVQAPNSSKMKLEPKPILRKRLGRSPDHAEAAMLSTWEPGGLESSESRKAEQAPQQKPTVHDEYDTTVQAMNPYDGVDPWG